MAQPQNRKEFIEYCRRSLGEPVVRLNIDSQQIEYRIDDALTQFQKFHHDASETVYLKFNTDDTDMTNQYFQVDDTILGVTRVLPFTDDAYRNFMSYEFQFRVNDVMQRSVGVGIPLGISSYFIARSYMTLISEIFDGEPEIDYSIYTNRLYVRVGWGTDIQVGKFVVAEAIKLIDPTTNTRIWSNKWLKEYATALIKRQWANNVKKMGPIPLVGGIILNGKEMFDEAEAEIAALEEELRSSYERPPMFLVG